MLTVDDMAAIMNELMLGMPPKLSSPKANAFREKVKRNLADMKQREIVCPSAEFLSILIPQSLLALTR